MKKIFTLLLFAFFLIFIQTKLHAQTPDDQASVLTACISIDGIQQYYPVDENGNIEQIHVMNYPEIFPSDLNVSYGDNPVAILSRDEISSNQVVAYFAFRNMTISGNSATCIINYFYNYDYSTMQFKTISISLTAQKVNDIWTIEQSNLNGDL